MNDQDMSQNDEKKTNTDDNTPANEDEKTIPVELEEDELQDKHVDDHDDDDDDDDDDNQAEVKKLQHDLAAMTEIAKRAMADLQNYKKRAEEERSGLQKFAALNLIIQLLPIHENFKRAFEQKPEELEGNQWIEGIIIIEKQFKDVLEKQGITEITADDEHFDPLKHEAMMKGPGELDKVIEVFEPGYMMGDKVLKPAKVKVGDGSPDENN